MHFSPDSIVADDRIITKLTSVIIDDLAVDMLLLLRSKIVSLGVVCP